MIPIKKVEDLIKKHSNLEKELSSGNFDKKLFAEKSKEYSDLNEIIKETKDYISFEKNKNDLEKIINDASSDKEIKEIAYIELQEIIKQHKINKKKIKLFLLPKDEADSKNAIIETVVESILNSKEIVTVIDPNKNNEAVGSLNPSKVVKVLFGDSKTNN